MIFVGDFGCVKEVATELDFEGRKMVSFVVKVVELRKCIEQMSEEGCGDKEELWLVITWRSTRDPYVCGSEASGGKFFA